jgi:hypothetical protein
MAMVRGSHRGDSLLAESRSLSLGKLAMDS